MIKKYISPTFCSLGWNHQFLGPNGNIKPCCRFISQTIPKTNHIRNDSTLNDVFNQPFQQELRQYMIKGERHAGCRKCWEEEDAGKKLSIRQNYNRDINLLENLHYDLDIDNPKITWLEFSFNNRCNIRCRMCGPYFSTNWYKDWATVKRYVGGVENINGKNTDEEIENYIKENPEPRTINLDKLDEVLPNIRHIKMTGGEPFIMPEYKEILRKLVECGQAKDVYLNYSTNLTIKPKKDLIELWEHFKHIEFCASLDGVGPVIEYIRYPSKWDTIIEVTKELMQLSKHMNIKVGIRPTITIYNILDVPNITYWWAEMMDKHYKEPFDNKAWINHTQASAPEHLTIQVLQPRYKDIVMKKLWDKGPTEKQKQNWNSLCNFMMAKDRTDLLTYFTDYTNRLDNARNESFEKSIPELGGLLLFGGTLE